MKEYNILHVTEYFCKDCGQLRLNAANSQTCGNCGSQNLIHGSIGTLDKKSLKLAFKEKLL